MTAVALAIATLFSEDLACVSAGLLLSQGHAGLASALLGCTLGIFLGDLGLFAVGRWGGGRLLELPFVRRRISPQAVERARRNLGKTGRRAVLAARFLPGARLPVYLGAGMLGMSPRSFIGLSLLACSIWTPLLVGLAAAGGQTVSAPLTRILGSAWLALPAAALLFFFALRMSWQLLTPVGRAMLAARVARLWRWEFWPAWVFYIPLLPWIGYLAWRHGGLKTITVANPAIPHGGIVGESKYAILKGLPSEWVVPTVRIDAGPTPVRVEQLRQAVFCNGWSFPIVLKPDVGERGTGFKRAETFLDAEAYLRSNPKATLVQAYHPGPYEAGVFFYRLPGEARGCILSITDKVFPVVTGDGSSTVEELIWRHPRFRMQAARFLARLNGQSSRVPAAGERLRLAVAGNHCQGTQFQDGAHLMTAGLEQRIDEIARSFSGFYFGRFDLRYSDPESLRAGEGFQIVELNGASSESTNLYDPRRSLFWAYRVLFRQWQILFQVAARNRKLGHRPTPYRELARLICCHYRRPRASLVAD